VGYETDISPFLNGSRRAYYLSNILDIASKLRGFESNISTNGQFDIIKDHTERIFLGILEYSRNSSGDLYSYQQEMVFQNVMQNIINYLGIAEDLKKKVVPDATFLEFEKIKMFFDYNTFNQLKDHLEYSCNYIIDQIKFRMESQKKV